VAKRLLEDSRKTIADYLSVWADEITFTASATEANNMALQGFPHRILAVAATEHSSVLAVAKHRADSIILPVDGEGLLVMEALEAALMTHPNALLVSVMLANNETGVIQPIAEIAKLVHEHGGLLHSDAVQALGKMPIDFNLLGVDMLTISAHKAGGAVGVGALIVRSGLFVEPLLLGGGQEKRRRAGTENIAAIVGMAKLIEIMPDLSHLRQWKNSIENEMLNVSRGTIILGQNAPRLPHVICAVMPEVSSETQLISFDLAGICMSAGSACSSGRIEPSHVLQAMGLSYDQANCALRISMGWGTTEAEVKQAIATWTNICTKLSKKVAA
jgi:cysteine desulfurase